MQDIGILGMLPALAAATSLASVNFSNNGATTAIIPDVCTTLVASTSIADFRSEPTAECSESYPPCSIFRADQNEAGELRSYGPKIQLGQDALNRTKLCLLGHSAVGKSTVAAALSRDPNFVPGRLSEGVNVTQTRLEGGTYVSIWDFAGREIFHAMHDALLPSDSALFLVLFDLRAAEEQQAEQLSYWLRLVSSRFAPGSLPKVVLVGTHRDLAPSDTTAAIPPRVLAEFGTVVDFRSPEVVLVASADAAAMAALSALAEATLAAIARQVQIPTPSVCKTLVECLDVSEQGGYQTRWLPWRDYARMVQPYVEPFGCSEDKLRLATRHLHRISRIVFVEAGGPSQDFVITNTAVLQALLGANLCSEQSQPFVQASSQGPVPLVDLARLVPLLAAPASLALLEHMQLCYSYEHVDMQRRRTVFYVFPMLLQQGQPRDLWGKSDAFDSHAGCKVSVVGSGSRQTIPEGAFCRVQVQLCRRLGPRSSGPNMHHANFALSLWHGGLWCANGIQAMVRLAPDRSSVLVHARATRNRSACAELVSTIEASIIETLHASPGFIVKKQICNPTHLQAYMADPQCFEAETARPLAQQIRDRRDLSPQHMPMHVQQLGFDAIGVDMQRLKISGVSAAPGGRSWLMRAGDERQPKPLNFGATPQYGLHRVCCQHRTHLPQT